MIQEKHIEWCGKAATICKQKLNIRISLFCCILFGRSRKQNLKTIVRCHIGICKYFSISRSECTLDSGLLSLFFLLVRVEHFFIVFLGDFFKWFFFYIRFHIFIVLLLGIPFVWIFDKSTCNELVTLSRYHRFLFVFFFISKLI